MQCTECRFNINGRSVKNYIILRHSCVYCHADILLCSISCLLGWLKARKCSKCKHTIYSHLDADSLRDAFGVECKICTSHKRKIKCILPDWQILNNIMPSEVFYANNVTSSHCVTYENTATNKRVRKPKGYQEKW